MICGKFLKPVYFIQNWEGYNYSRFDSSAFEYINPGYKSTRSSGTQVHMKRAKKNIAPVKGNIVFLFSFTHTYQRDLFSRGKIRKC